MRSLLQAGSPQAACKPESLLQYTASNWIAIGSCTDVCYLLLRLVCTTCMLYTHVFYALGTFADQSSSSLQLVFLLMDKLAAGMNQCSPNDCSCPTSSDPTSVCPCFSVTNGQYHCKTTASGAVLLQGPGYNSAGSCTGQTTAPACKDSGLALDVACSTCTQHNSVVDQ